jgi:class 3 adenylate cyclase
MTKQTQVAILFADASGFSSLSSSQLSTFASQVMTSLADIAKRYSPLVQNTWGDALFLVFNTAKEAAECTLLLRDKIQDTDWDDLGIAGGVQMRFALHNAHAILVTDPFTGRSNAYGEHINRTARLEPVALANEIFATAEFKVALDAFNQQRLFAWDPVGKIPLAKGWPAAEVYRLRRPKNQPLTPDNLKALGKGPKPLEVAMPNTHRTLGELLDDRIDLMSLVQHIDHFFFASGIFRANWTINLSYDLDEVATRGVITEHITWSYDLFNINKTAITYLVALIGTPDFEAPEPLISFHELLDDGTERRLLSQHIAASDDASVFRAREERIELRPRGHTKIEMRRYSQQWPVNPHEPAIYNELMPRESSFGTTRFNFEVPVNTRIGVLFRHTEVRPAFQREGQYVYNFPSPMLGHECMEYQLKFST